MGTGEISFRELPYNFDDGEDALSLSDLPLTSNSSDWEEEEEEEEYFSYIRGGRSPCSDQDLFEFSTSCDSSKFEDNIIFCGKLIPYREARVSNNINSKPKDARKSSNEDGKVLAATSKGGRVGADLGTRKMLSPLKSRWYLFAFGVGRFPMTMERSDLKTRQSKKRRVSYPTNDRREMSNSSSGSRPRTSILWSILNNIGRRHLI